MQVCSQIYLWNVAWLCFQFMKVLPFHCINEYVIIWLPWDVPAKWKRAGETCSKNKKHLLICTVNHVANKTVYKFWTVAKSILTQMHDNGVLFHGPWYLSPNSVLLPSNPGNEVVPPMIFISLYLQKWVWAQSSGQMLLFCSEKKDNLESQA